LIHLIRDQASWLFRAAVFSIPDTFSDRGRSILDVQAVNKEIPNSECHNQLHSLVIRCRNSDKAVAIPMINQFDDSCRPTLDIMGWFSGMDSIMIHKTTKTCLSVYLPH
jgi:hypothetical protein